MLSNKNRQIKNTPDMFNKLLSHVKSNSIKKLMISNWSRSCVDYDDHYWFCYLNFLGQTDDASALMIQLFKAMQANTSITELRINEVRIHGDAYAVFKSFCKMIKKNQYFEVVELNAFIFYHKAHHTLFDSKPKISLSPFLDALLSSSSISSIKFDDIFAYDSLDNQRNHATKQFCQFLSKRKHHSSLRLSFNNSRIKYDEVLSFIMKNNISVDDLEISTHGYGGSHRPDFSCIKLLTSYLQNYNLSSLSLRYESLSSLEETDLDRVLCEVIFNSISLQKIYIQKLHESLSNLSLDRLAPNSTRQELTFNDFEFTTDLFIKLSHIIRNSLVLKKLTLGAEEGMGMIARNSELIGFELLMQAIAEHPTLEILEIKGGQCLLEEELSLIHEMVMQRAKPLTLNLSDLDYINRDKKPYLEMLGSILSHPSIKSFIYVPQIRLTFEFEAKTLEPILQAIKLNPFLQILDLRRNSIGNEGAKLIAQAILSNPYSSIQSVMLDESAIDEVHQKIVNDAIVQVKDNIVKAIRPFHVFSALSCDRDNPIYLPVEITGHIVRYGLFSTFDAFRRESQLNGLASDMIKAQQERYMKK